MAAWYTTMMEGFRENRDLKNLYSTVNKFMTQTLNSFFKQVKTMRPGTQVPPQISQGIQQSIDQTITYLGTIASKIASESAQRNPQNPNAYALSNPAFLLAKNLIEVMKQPPTSQNPPTLAKEIHGFTIRMQQAEQYSAEMYQQYNQRNYQQQIDPKVFEVVRKYQKEPTAIQALSEIYTPQVVQTILQNININPGL
jgi:hypothetical protein